MFRFDPFLPFSLRLREDLNHLVTTFARPRKILAYRVFLPVVSGNPSLEHSVWHRAYKAALRAQGHLPRARAAEPANVRRSAEDLS